jgi:Cytosine/adenosine deaminases
MFTIFSDEHFMKAALNEAKKGAAIGEVPVGAVIVSNNQIIAKAHNQTQQLNDVTAHAEMLAITAAADYLGAKYLQGCTLFITLEPCIMCAGALYWSQIDRIVVGASDDKRGFMRYGKALLHPKTKMELGVLESLSKELLQDFFSQKRRIR